MKLKKMLLGTIIGITLYSCISVVAFANTEEVRVYDVDTETTSITTFSYSGNETADEELLEPSYGTVGQESADPEEEDVVVYIMKGAAGSEDEEEMAAYEMVEDEGELQAVYAVFQQMLDDVNFEWRSDF